MEYDIEIERGRHPINDRIFDFLLDKIHGSMLDVGANTGYLVQQWHDRGHISSGIEKSKPMVTKALELQRDVLYGDACDLPFENKQFDTVVLSCILEQIPNWRTALSEAYRVGKKVIGICPIPYVGRWGKIGGWVVSIIDPKDLQFVGTTHLIEYIDNERYYFEIT